MTLRVAVIVAGLLAALAVAVGVFREVEHRGALKALTAQARATLDSTAHAARQKVDSLASATEKADRERRLLRQHQARDHADSAKLAAAVVALASARDSALAVLADSLASAARLRETLTRQLAASDSSERAHGVVETGLRSRLAEAFAQVVRDSVNQQLAHRALDTQRKATDDAVKLANLYKQQIPSRWWTLVKWGALIEGGRVSAGKFP